NVRRSYTPADVTRSGLANWPRCGYTSSRGGRTCLKSEGTAMAIDVANLAFVLQRVEKLARQNRWLRCGGLMVLVFFGAVFLLGGQRKPAPETLEASKIILRDAAGKERAVLFVDEDIPHLVFYDAKGQRHVQLTAQDDGGALTLYDQKG